MGCYGTCTSIPRNYLTRDEKIEVLSEYKEQLENESKAVIERIEELKKAG